jgi:parallel beta-helix repeat protein
MEIKQIKLEQQMMIESVFYLIMFSNSIIERIYVDSTYGIGINARSSSGILINKCIVKNAGTHGIALGNSNATHPLAISNNCIISNCIVLSSGSAVLSFGMGIGIFYSHDCEVVNNIVDGTVEGNISIYSNDATAMCYRNIVTGNTCLNAGNVGNASGSHGITSNDGSKQLIVSNNIIYNAKAFGIIIDSASAMSTAGDDTIVSSNQVYNSGSRGIDIKVGERLKIHDNKVNVAGSEGIRVLSPGLIKAIRNNDVTSASSDGIQIWGGKGCVISGNNVKSCTSNGIKLLGVTYSAVQGNITISNGGSGMTLINDTSLNGCIYNAVTGNTSTLNTNAGIAESGNSNNNIFTSNIARGNTGSGLTTVGGSDVSTNNITI